MPAIDTKPTNTVYLQFEDQVAQFDRQIEDLRKQDQSLQGPNAAEIRRLQKEQTKLLQELYSGLSAWQTVQVSRHPQRPLLNDYLSLMFKDVRHLHGDRCFGDDKAIVTAMGQIGREKVMIIGHNKGKDIKEKIACNFGCANPEGYRKALAKMKLAEKFGLPIITLIDTPGAYPGIGAEERGQSQAIAVNLMEMSRLRVPIICVVIGEGGSGGALGIGVGDRLAMLQYSYYSVISPEGCAAILWHDGSQAPRAAEALKLTAKDLQNLKLVDTVIAEPLGGAHRNTHDTIYSVEQFLLKSLAELKRIKIDALMEKRYQKIRSFGSGCVEISRLEPKPTKRSIPKKLSARALLEQAEETPVETPVES
jgi:acetyl-CoA carboxylase carboxyl transferase subunit alpha